MTANSISDRRKGRIGHSKSKSGCLTCKVRRVKCGEEKPQCYRCTSTGRKCDYKPTVGHDFRSWSRNSASQSPLLLAIDFHPSESPHYSLEQRAFEFFFMKGSPIFPGAMNDRFWKTCVLQACHTEPVIWDAVISFSALFEDPQYSDKPVLGLRGGPHTSPRMPVKHRTHQQALMWYNRSISKLRMSLEKGTANNAVVLISCILYICIELLQDNVSEVIQLYCRGASIISNCNAPFLQECIAPLFYSFGALAIFTDYIPLEQAVRPVSEVSDTFSNLEEAEFVLYRFLPQIVSLNRESAKVLYTKEPVEKHIIARLEEQKNFLCATSEQWLQKFQALGITLEGDASPAEKFALAKLLQAYATFRVAIGTSATISEMANDEVVGDYEDIVRYGRYGIEATRYPDGTQPPFSFETSFALPLFICAIRCRDYRIRHEALDLLWEAPKVQGLYKSASHALMASKIINIEEAGLELLDQGDGKGPSIFIPESHRIANVSVTSKENENGEQLWALKYTRYLPDEGGYRAIEELCPFDSSDS